MTPAPLTGAIYSCDDHLDLSAVPPTVWESRLPRRHAERGPRVDRRGQGRPVGVRGPGDRPQRHAEEQGAGEEAQRDRPRRHRRRRLPRRDAAAPDPGHGPGRPRGVRGLRPAVARVPDRRRRAAGRDLRRVERLGRRGIQRVRTRAVVRARVPAVPFGRRGGGRARTVRRARPSRRDRRRVPHRPRRSGVGPALVGGRRARPAHQLPHQRRRLAQAQLPDRQVAVGGIRDAPADATRRAARHDGVLGRARTAPRTQAGARGVGDRLAAVLPHPHGRRVARAGPEARLRAEGRAERARPQPGDPDVRAGVPRRAVHPAWSVPRRACGRRTTRTPTARSRTPATRSANRSARCRRTTCTGSPRPTALISTGSRSDRLIRRTTRRGS